MEEIWKFIVDNAAAVGAVATAVAVLITLVTVFFRGVTTVGASLSKHLKGKKKKARQGIVESRKPGKIGAPGPSEPTVFISYSRKDEVWMDRLLPQLKALEQVGHITVWNDRQIGAGDKWFDEIKEVMDRTTVAVCLISADYLASDFVMKEEIPYLLERREHNGMVIVPVLLRPCPWKTIPWLSGTQMLPGDGQALARELKDDWEAALAEVAERVFEIVTDPASKPAAPPPRWPEPEKVDIDRLPATGAELFGRQEDLALLDDTWEAEGTNLVSLVAWGGVGKSTLVNKWLERMAADNYRGARRVFAWSFYSQGTGERVTSADQFIAAALEWFGDDDPTKGSPWDKGQRLADLVRKEPTLLVLDGMEPLQSDLDFEEGKIKDPALAVLVSELARENAGLCVISTREAVADLAPFRATTREKNLEQISDEAGRALLRVGGVRGTDAELEAATRDFGNHALALNLLAAYLRDIHGHHISHAAEIPDLDIPDDKGRHPRRLMAAFAQRFGEGAEVELLRVLGLFDRPAEAEAIAAVRTAPAIPDLTASLLELPEGDWRDLLGKLRRTGLMAPESEHRPDTLDAHPLVREHFGQQLREDHPDAWREGNDRLYEHYKQAAPELPDTLEEMAPLFAAVAHGCAAGRHQEALDDVYWRRIQRGDQFFSIRRLGAFGANLAALASFFDPPWRHPVAELKEAQKSFVLSNASTWLRALGRLAEAAPLEEFGLELDIAGKDWPNAAIAAGNVSELYLTMGDPRQALEFAQQSVAFSDKSDVAFLRMAMRTTSADALHQAGRAAEAETLFRKAEEMQKERQPELPLLYSTWGFRYCDLLLDQGKHKEVQDRAGKALALEEQGSGNLVDIGLNHLSLGRAHFSEAQQKGAGDFTQAAEQLDHAVDGLRQSGNQDNIPHGLLARAALHRVRGDLERARRDLDAAMAIAERGGMGLHQADAHLEFARLYLAMGEEAKARERLASAKEMIGRMGYHRRDGEVAELEERLKVG